MSNDTEPKEVVQQSSEVFKHLDPETVAWLEERKDAAKHIDPQTAEITFNWGEVGDPYGVFRDCPEAHECIGRNYFARKPGSEIWVSFHDLPLDVVHKIWERLDRKAAAPPDDECPF